MLVVSYFCHDNNAYWCKYNKIPIKEDYISLKEATKKTACIDCKRFPIDFQCGGGYFFFHTASICSRVLPLVSGTIFQTKIADRIDIRP